MKKSFEQFSKARRVCMVYPGQKNIKLQYFRFALVDDKNRFDIAKDPIIIQTERKNSNIRNTMRF